VHEPYQICLTLLGLAYTFRQQGKLEAALKNDEEAQTLSGHFPGSFADSEIKMAFARVNLAGARFNEAETNARAALNGFTRSGREGDRMMAAGILARALVAEGKIQQASEALIQAPSLDENDLPVWVPLEFQIAKADCLAHSGKPAEAARMMEAAAAQMQRLGLPALEKEAQTAKQSFR